MSGRLPKRSAPCRRRAVRVRRPGPATAYTNENLSRAVDREPASAAARAVGRESSRVRGCSETQAQDVRLPRADCCSALGVERDRWHAPVAASAPSSRPEIPWTVRPRQALDPALDPARGQSALAVSPGRHSATPGIGPTNFPASSASRGRRRCFRGPLHERIPPAGRGLRHLRPGTLVPGAHPGDDHRVPDRRVRRGVRPLQSGLRVTDPARAGHRAWTREAKGRVRTSRPTIVPTACLNPRTGIPAGPCATDSPRRPSRSRGRRVSSCRPDRIPRWASR